MFSKPFYDVRNNLITKNYEKNILKLLFTCAMLPALEIIPNRRKKLGLTQSQLANMAGVSQSYIAKLESGNIEPSYVKVKAIFESLDKMERKKEVQASEVMNRKIVVLEASSTINEAVEKMREYGYSQLPIMEKDKPIGGISERIVLERIVNNIEDVNPNSLKVRDIMEESFPQVAEDAPLTLLSSLLKYYPAVLVQNKGKVVGIITKSDILGTIN
jgi:predicted transcriptional regulator